MITYTGTGDYRANRTGPRDTAAIDPRTDPRPGGRHRPPGPSRIDWEAKCRPLQIRGRAGPAAGVTGAR